MLSEVMAAVGLGDLPQDPHSVFSTSNRGSSYSCWKEGFRLAWLLALMHQAYFLVLCCVTVTYAYLLKL